VTHTPKKQSSTRLCFGLDRLSCMVEISRRTAVSVVASGVLFSQQRNSFAVLDSSSGLRLEQYGNPQRPTVALFLPAAKSPSAVIEMPEHAWRKEKPTDEPKWIYKMYSSDRALVGALKWSKEGNSIGFTMKTPSGYGLSSKAVLESDGVTITHEVTSGSVQQIAAVEAVTCVKLYRPFTDVFLDRTYVHHPDGLDLIASETQGRAETNAEEWLPCRYIARVGKNAPKGEYRVEKLDGITRYFKSRPTDVAFLATESLPTGWTAATFASNCDSVFTNPARTCHHVDPTIRDIPDGRANIRLKVYLLRGDALDAWRHVTSAERLG
jgi:hypothetical protein